MNKKVLSAILFGALMAGTGTFTSCIDNDEPAGIEELRGAKAELIRAKVAVQQAEASYKLAQAEVEKAEAAIKNAEAQLKKALVEEQELKNELQSITNESERAALEAQIAAAERDAEVAKLQHEEQMISLNSALALAKRNYELTLAQIEIAKATLSEQAQVTVSELQLLADAAQTEVETAQAEVEAAEEAYYNATLDAKKNTVTLKRYELAVSNAEANLAAQQEAYDAYKNFLSEDVETADWRAEISEIEATIDSLNKNVVVLNLEAAKLRESDEYKALLTAVTEAEEAVAEAAEALTLEEDLEYTYIYLNGKDVEVKIAKETAMTEAGKQIAGADFMDAEEYAAGIAVLKQEIASYTTEKMYWLDSIAAKDAATQTAIDKAAATAVENWTKAVAAYDAANKAKPLSKDAIFKAGEKATDPDTGAAVVYTESVIAADAKKASGAYTEAEYNEAILLAKQKFADALVAWYNTLPATQVTFRTITLGTVVDSETIYASKTVKEWLSDASLKHKNLDKLYAYFNGQMDALWNVGAKAEEKNTNGSVKTATTGVFATWTDKAALVADAESKLKTASDVAFGPAVNYYGTAVVSGAAQWYLHNKPTLEDIKYVFNKGLSVGAYGLNVLGEDENIDFIANNYKDIIADYEAAIEYWTAAVEDIKAALAEQAEAVETAEEAVEAAEEAVEAYEEENFEAVETAKSAIAERIESLNRVKTALTTAVEAFLGENYEGAVAFETWLNNKAAEALEAVYEAENALIEAQNTLTKAQDGKINPFDALAEAEENLAEAMAELAAAQAELEAALANLSKGLEILAETNAK